MTINGNGRTIDASNLARIFNITADNVIIKNLTLINDNVTDDNGGAICWDGANGKITDSTLNHNFASGATTQGGAIFAAGVNLEVDNCIFNDNAAGNVYDDNNEKYGGGSIYIATDGCNVSNSKFSNAGIANQYIRNGAGILVNGTNAKVTGCTFTDLKATFSGAGVCTNSNASGFEISDCIFKNNVGNNGGALVVKANSNIDNCTFDNCSACFGNALLAGKGSGGGLAIPQIGLVVINDCSFINCHSSGSGEDLANGALNVHREVNNAIISGNTLFKDCTATERTGIYGDGAAALYCECKNTTIEGNLTITDCSVMEGKDNHKKGGAIVNYGRINATGNLTIENCAAAEDGGVIYNANYGENYPGELIISGSAKFINNTAGGSGGVIYNYEGNVTLSGDMTLENNSATNDGGVIYNDAGNLGVDGAKFIGNEANEGSVIYNTGNLIITNVEIIPAEGDNKPSISSTVPVMNIIMNKTIVEGDILNVTVYVSKDNAPATGNITLIDDNGPTTKSLVDGVVSFNVTDLSAGEHILTIEYHSEDGTYNASASEKVMVRTNSNISVNVEDIKVGQDAIITVTTPEDATRDVTLTIGDKTQVAPIKNGIATFKVSGLTV